MTQAAAATRTPLLLLALVLALLWPAGPVGALTIGDGGGSGPTEPTAATVKGQLRAALDRGDRGRRVPPRTVPSLDSLSEDKTRIDGACTADLIEETRHEICHLGDPDGSRSAVLLGSSHAAMWFAGLDEAAAAGDTRLTPFIKFGCSPQVMRQRVYGESWPACAEWRRWMLREVASLRPDVVVVGTHTYAFIDDRRGVEQAEGTPRYERLYARGMSKLVARLRQTVPEVVVLGGLVRRDRTRPLRCLERNDRRLAPCVQRVDRRTRQMLSRDREATTRSGGRFVDSNRMACLGRRCPVAAHGKYVFRDFSHVSRTWSLHVGPLLSRKVGLTG